TVPLSFTPPGASRIVVASCDEGLGYHGLFPFMNAPPSHRRAMLQLRVAASLNKPGRLLSKGTRRLVRMTARSRPSSASPGHPTWLFCPSREALDKLPATVPGYRMTSSWSEVVEGVSAEQNHDSP